MNLFQQYERDFMRESNVLSKRKDMVSDGALDAQVREAEELVREYAPIANRTTVESIKSLSKHVLA